MLARFNRILPGCAIIVLLSPLLVPAARAATATVSVPLYLDYPLLRHLVAAQLFDFPATSREILDDPTGCSRILVSEPRIDGQRDSLRVIAAVEARLGVAAFGACRELLNWQGEAGFLGRPVIRAGARSIALAPQDTWLIGADGKKIESGVLWEAGHASLESLFAGLVLDLSPYIDSFGAFLPDVLPHRSKEQLQSMLDSLRLAEIAVAPAGLDVAIEFAVEELERSPQQAAALSERELQEVEQKWQMMDALLVGAVKHYAAATRLQDLRDTLFDILIDSRYRLRDALTEPAQRSDDAVRRWFIESWQRLAPVARSVALEQPGQEHLLWFSVLTVTDALYTLDQLGPGIGLDISSNGLRHLARLINAHSGDDWLRYSEDVDPQLRQLLEQQLESTPSESPPEPAAPEPAALRLNFSFFARAHAASPADRLNRWVPAKKELGAYLPVIAELLEETAAQVSAELQLDQRYADIYRDLVLTTAWQESCWRQYTVIEQRIEPLRSSSGDTGLMQINERVWRGFYDIQKLRWDINYNVRAGAEVLLNYLVKYAVRKGEHRQTGGLSNLARASYSAYNGGPGQVARYRRSGVPSAQRKVDALFWDKYQQVERGNKLNVVACLDGAASGASLAAASARPVASPATIQAADKQSAPISPGRTAGAADTASRWLLAQPAQHFTLQLATFSTRDAASNFIRQQALPTSVYVYARRQGQSIQYLVLHGSYPSRAAADPDKRHYASLQPWLRQFVDLH